MLSLSETGVSASDSQTDIVRITNCPYDLTITPLPINIRGSCEAYIPAAEAGTICLAPGGSLFM